MIRHGFLGDVGKWVLPVVLLFLVIACSQKLFNQPQGNGNPEVQIKENVETGPVEVPDGGSTIHEGKTQPGPSERDIVSSELDHMETHPDRKPGVQETKPTPTPTPTSSGKPSSKPGKGSVPAAQKPAESAPVDPEEKPALNADDYKAVLDVTEKMELRQKGDLRVWIGLEDYVPEEEADMVRRETSMPADIGNYARITPYAPDFTIEPEEYQIMRIVPSGSSVLFTIIPEKKGEFKISAKIELFDNPYFEGVPIPKTTNIVSVVVTVDPKVKVLERLGELGSVVWDNFLKFWGAVVALLFGTLFFVIRRRIKKKTGYEGTGKELGGKGAISDSASGESEEGTETVGEEEGSAEEAGEEEDEEGIDYFDVGEGGESGEMEG